VTLQIRLFVQLSERYYLNDSFVRDGHQGLAWALRSVKVFEVTKSMRAYLHPSSNEIVCNTWFETVELSLKNNWVILASKVV
jgi:hypothetical protein